MPHRDAASCCLNGCRGYMVFRNRRQNSSSVADWIHGAITGSCWRDTTTPLVEDRQTTAPAYTSVWFNFPRNTDAEQGEMRRCFLYARWAGAESSRKARSQHDFSIDSEAAGGEEWQWGGERRQSCLDWQRLLGQNPDPNRGDRADNNFSSLDRVLGSFLRKEISKLDGLNPSDSLQHLDKPRLDTGTSHRDFIKSILKGTRSDGTRDSPVLLDDDVSSTPEAATVCTSVENSADPPWELRKTTLSTSDKPPPHSLLAPDEYDRAGSDEESVSELEEHMPRAFEEQEKSSAAADITFTKTAEPRGVSQSDTSDEGEKEDLVRQQGAEGQGVGWQDEDEEEEDVVGELEDTEMQVQQEHEAESELEGEDKELDKLATDGCLHNREEEDVSDNSEDEGYDCDSIDQEDEDIRPAKRRRLPSPLSDKGHKDCSQRHTMPNVKQTLRPLPTATEGGHMKSKAIRTRARNSTPFCSFLKSISIRNDTTFNLEFYLVDVLDHPELSTLFKALYNNDQPSTQPRVSHSTVTHSKTHNIKSTPLRKRTLWTQEEDCIREFLGNARISVVCIFQRFFAKRFLARVCIQIEWSRAERKVDFGRTAESQYPSSPNKSGSDNGILLVWTGRIAKRSHQWAVLGRAKRWAALQSGTKGLARTCGMTGLAGMPAAEAEARKPFAEMNATAAANLLLSLVQGGKRMRRPGGSAAQGQLLGPEERRTMLAPPERDNLLPLVE
ncbi:hypothetical protein G7Y89_g12508 [Cudoniella acicularis]|uniref:Uncharacterized protein n=1 Tax=Cudoniella acicularis TaxID=354080 RepID=A0A8H4R9Y8_9HELO|nr:hypothetical protein G7Y89_g12508 [Cudoniella acicularis]